MHLRFLERSGRLAWLIVALLAFGALGSSALAQSLPSPWGDGDIGSPGVAGSASYSSGTFTVNGGGADIWGTSDQFNYMYQTTSGDGTITAKVATQQYTNPWAKSGVMFRASTAANDMFVDVIVTPAEGLAMHWRTTAGGSANGTNATTGIVAPYWVRIVRSGTTFTGYSSADGSTWTQVGSVTISMSASATVGLAVCAHDNTQLNTSTFQNVAFSGSGGSVPGTPTNLTATPASCSQINLSWTASTGTVTGYYVYRGGSKIATVTTTSYSDTGLAANTQYSYYVVAYNSNGNSGNSNTAQATTQSCSSSYSLWSSSTVPGTPDSGPDSAVNLGVRFKASQAGTISGIRFYKSSNNTGTHIGTLYTDSGTQLAQATFSGESASGWQQVNFTAVSISANTTYVAAYECPNGHYAADASYFASAYVNGPLTAPADNPSSDRNSVYTYGSTPAFPTSTYQEDNYYVDVVFNATGGGSVPGTPTNLSAVAASCSQINLSWTASTGTVTGYYVYRGGSQIATTSSTSYSDTGLAASTQYSYYVVGYNGYGNSGNSNTAQATTPSCGGSGGPTNLQGLASSATQNDLVWTAGTGSISSYNVYRNGSLVGTAAYTAYTDTGLTANTQYSYYVGASGYSNSNTIQVTTLTSASGGLPTLLRTFFPLGPDGQPTSNLSTWASRGANTLIRIGGGENFTSWNSTANALGLKYIRGPASPASADVGNTNLLSWHQDDEPCSGDTSASLQSLFAQWKATDITRPVSVNLAPGGMLGLGGCTAAQNQPYIDNTSDWAMNDIYPVAGWDAPNNVIYPNNWVGEALQQMAAISRGRPQMQFVECAEQNLSWCPQCPAPTPGQFHTEFWDAIINGARGVFLFPEAISPFYWDNTTPAMQTQIEADWATVKALTSALQTTVNPSGMSATVTAPLEAGWRNSGHQYFIVDNTDSNAHNSQTITLTGTGSATSAVVYGESRNVNIVSGVITDNFAANAVHIYQVN